MYVLKRDGRKEDVKFDKITARIKKLCWGLDSKFVDPVSRSLHVVLSIMMIRRKDVYRRTYDDIFLDIDTVSYFVRISSTKTNIRREKRRSFSLSLPLFPFDVRKMQAISTHSTNLSRNVQFLSPPSSLSLSGPHFAESDHGSLSGSDHVRVGSSRS